MTTSSTRQREITPSTTSRHSFQVTVLATSGQVLGPMSVGQGPPRALRPFQRVITRTSGQLWFEIQHPRPRFRPRFSRSGFPASFNPRRLHLRDPSFSPDGCCACTDVYRLSVSSGETRPLLLRRNYASSRTTPQRKRTVSLLCPIVYGQI